MENTPSFPGKQFLQGKEEFTLPDMEKMPALLGNQFLQGNEKDMDTGTFASGSIILNRYPMLSTLTHTRRVPQNFQQLKMESSNMVALPCFNYNAEATIHMETPKNVHSQDSHSNKSDQLKKSKVQSNQLTRFSHHFNTDFTCDQKSLPRDRHNYWNNKETLSTNLKIDTNMDTNHMTTIPMAHKAVYLLSRPLKAMAHRYHHTKKEAHLLSGPSELQLPDASEAQKIRSPTHIQQSRQEYSQLTENSKAKFHITYIPNGERNYVECCSVNKIPSDLVHPTKSNTPSVSDSIFSERREEIAEDIPAPAEDVPAPAEDAPAPAPAPHWRQ